MPRDTPAQITTGLRAVLSHPMAYGIAQRLSGGQHARRALVRDFLRVRPGERVLDIGCGPGSMLACLPDAPFDYIGYDASPEYILHASRRFKTRGRFVCGTVDEDVQESDASFDWVLAMGLLHHIDDNDSRKLFAIAHAKLKPGGSLVTLDGVYTDTQSAVTRYVLSRDRGQHVRTTEAYVKLARTAFDAVESHVREWMFYIPYTALVLRCTR
jgi:cyclopropane fatty-acyl-phospholipid synthase-like methyltransferase